MSSKMSTYGLVKRLPLVLAICLPLCGAAWYFAPDKSQETAIREAVFLYQIGDSLRGWKQHTAEQRRRTEAAGQKYQPQEPLFWLETRNWNSTVLADKPVDDATVKRLQGRAFRVAKPDQRDSQGTHLHAGAIHWSNRNRVEVDGGSMSYGKFGATGSGARYFVERRGGKWVVVREEMTAIT